MIKILVDEDLPRSTGVSLKAEGYAVLDVRDIGLRGKSDDEVFRHARQENAALLTGDLGFGNLLHFPLGNHPGIIIANFPNEFPSFKLNVEIVQALKGLADDDVRGNLVILEPGRIRIKKA